MAYIKVGGGKGMLERRRDGRAERNNGRTD